MAILDVQDLCKTYRKGKQPAVDHLTFAVEEGAIYAFVGPNGAGKTTTIRIIATLLRADSGDVLVGGYRVDTERRDVRRLIGFIPDEFGLYGEMLVREYLEFFAGCYGVITEKRAPMVTDLLELVGLAHRRDDAVQTLSRGMRQRLGVARALVHDPALIIADEPAAGLDPRARVELREIFRALREMGKTIFLSSHVLRELDDVATHAGIIEQGRLVASGTVDEIRARLRPHRRVRVAFLGPADDAQAWLAGHPQVLGVEVVPVGNRNGGPPALWVTLSGGEETAGADTAGADTAGADTAGADTAGADTVVQLLAELVAAGFPVLAYAEEQDTLESLFLSLTQGIVT